jgi:hypothetical protein
MASPEGLSPVLAGRLIRSREGSTSGDGEGQRWYIHDADQLSKTRH